MLDIDTMIQITAEEKKIALEGAYNDGSLVGQLKKAINKNPWEYLGQDVY